MHYEIYFRMPGEADRLPAERALAALAKVGWNAEALPAEIDLGQGRLEVQGYRGAEPTDGDLEGLNLAFPLGLDPPLAERAVAQAFELAAALGARLFDPQLGELVGSTDHDRILSAWRRQWEFQAGVVGSLALGGGSPAPLAPSRPRLSARVKVLLFLIGAFLLVVFLFHTCLSRWAERSRPAEPPLVSAPGQGR